MNQTGINRTSDIILYAYTFRSRAERVIWALNELELEYRLVRLDPLKGENRTESFLQLNPAGKIPVLVHGETVVTESLAVMEYVDSIAAPGSLIPADPGGQSRYRQLVYFMMSEIESYLWIADQATRLKRI
jgi:glutathione S-transferase